MILKATFTIFHWSKQDQETSRWFKTQVFQHLVLIQEKNKIMITQHQYQYQNHFFIKKNARMI